MSDSATFSTIPVYVKSASVWLEIPVTNTTVPSKEAETFDVSNSKSANFRQFVVSPLVDPGTLDFTVNFVPSDPVYQYLLSQVGSPTASIWKTTFLYDGAKEWEFTGSLTKFAPAGGKVGEILTADASVKVSGAVIGSF